MSNEWYDVEFWQWVDSDISQWGFIEIPAESETRILNHIWTDNDYAYIATISGLTVVDIDTELKVSVANDPNGYSSVWSNNSYVFIGSSAGVKILAKSDIGCSDVSSYIYDYSVYPSITSNNVKHIHGNYNILMYCTDSGVDIERMDSRYITHTVTSGIQKCFVTGGSCYYTIYNGSESSVNRVDNNKSDWDIPDIKYDVGYDFIDNSVYVKDFFVTYNTSIEPDSNTLFIVTDTKVVVYDEGSFQYEDITYLLKNNNYKYASIYTDGNTSINKGKAYIATTGSGAAFYVIDMENKVLCDYYDINSVRSEEDILDSEDIACINVN